MSSPVEIFFSYAPEDAALCLELEKHLSPLKRERLISTWNRRQLIAGTDWASDIDQHLENSSLILLLLSADFIASDYCYGKEMLRAMERHEANQARVIPILLRPVDGWEHTPFGKLQALPGNAIPITAWRNRSTAFTDVAKGIRTVLANLKHLQASAPSTTFPPIWNIPYARNPYFTGQQEILTQLQAKLKQGQITALSQPQAISGLGGIGKTQIAIEYAHQHAQDYRIVLWSRADTTDALISGYVTIAGLLNLPEKDEQDQTITVKAVLHWFKTHREWLLILDNADELKLLKDFLPTVFSGHILLTTRAQATGKLASRLEVMSMQPDIGALFLLRRAKILATDGTLEDAHASDLLTARQIAEELGGLPLALDQAGAYIEETQCCLTDYQQLYRTRRAEMLQTGGSLPDDYPESVATTWSLCFEKVEQSNPAAADLLRFCAFVHPDAIPEDMITEGAEHFGQPLQETVSKPLLFNRAIAALGAYSLLRRDAQTKTLSIHRLVAVVLSDAMDEQTQTDWQRQAVAVVAAARPGPTDVEQWDNCEQWLPHALLCSSWIERQQMRNPQSALLLNAAGYYLDERARYAEAEPLYERALAIREQVLGASHPDTARSLNNLAALYESQGRYAEAEPLYERALAIREQALEDSHPSTANSLNNLAALYRSQGRYTEAEPLYERALAIREQVLGASHPDTANSLNNLAALYNDQGRYAEAEPLLKRALAIYEQVLGASHPDTASCLNNLAYLYDNQGRYAEAEPLYERALAVREQVLGASHPSTALSLNNLAHLYESQGRYAEAEPLYERALATYEKQLGIDHPTTQIVRENYNHFLQAREQEKQRD